MHVLMGWDGVLIQFHGRCWERSSLPVDHSPVGRMGPLESFSFLLLVISTLSIGVFPHGHDGEKTRPRRKMGGGPERGLSPILGPASPFQASGGLQKSCLWFSKNPFQKSRRKCPVASQLSLPPFLTLVSTSTLIPTSPCLASKVGFYLGGGRETMRV